MVGRNAERGARGAGRGVLHLGIVSQVANELHAIQILHGRTPLCSPSRKGKQECFPQGAHGQNGVNDGKGAPERSGGAFILTLAEEGREAP